MRVLFFDFMNAAHRCAYGMDQGEFSTIYTFFRSLRAQVELLKADKIIFALEGHPQFRYDICPEYKANRKIPESNIEKTEKHNLFRKQRDVIIDLLKRMPVEILQHPKYEADDLIGTLVSTIYKNDDCVIITGDTDYYQLFDSAPHVKIYNPIKKQYMEKTMERYLLHKSILGDTSDNISGIEKGIGIKTTAKIMNKSPEDFEIWLSEKEHRKKSLDKNLKLITFANVPIEEIKKLETYPDYDYIFEKFQEMSFNTITNEKSWDKFVDTFTL